MSPFTVFGAVAELENLIAETCPWWTRQRCNRNVDSLVVLNSQLDHGLSGRDAERFHCYRTKLSMICARGRGRRSQGIRAGWPQSFT